MPGRAGKVTAKKTLVRQASPEIPSPVKVIESTVIDNEIDDDSENKVPTDEIDTKQELPPVDSNDDQTAINPMTILLANGQPLLTNFEEKYLLDVLLKASTKDLETILHEKIQCILQMNYGSQQSSLFTLNTHWIFDFTLKHFQTLADHCRAQEFFEKLLNRKIDKTNPTSTFKHWQLQTLVDEYSKKQQSSNPPKRRMTVRRIDLN